jgi:transposase
VSGAGIRAISRELNLTRYTVRKILHTHQRQRDEGHDLLAASRRSTPRPSKLERFVPQIKALLAEFPDITGERVFEDLKAAGATFGITILRERLQHLRHRPKRQPTVRFETDPGVQGQMDWSPYTIPFTRSGKSRVECFSYILGFSRRQYIDFSPRRDFFTLIRRHQQAFEYFGGVPRHCLYDSEKTESDQDK